MAPRATSTRWPPASTAKQSSPRAAMAFFASGSAATGVSNMRWRPDGANRNFRSRLPFFSRSCDCPANAFDVIIGVDHPKRYGKLQHIRNVHVPRDLRDEHLQFANSGGGRGGPTCRGSGFPRNEIED